MREKIIALAIGTYTQNLWERNDITSSEQEVKQILKEVGLNTIDARKMANWEFVITLYDEAKKTKEIEVLKAAILDRLKDRKYMTENVLMNLLKDRNLTKNYHLGVLHDYMNNAIKAEDRKCRRIDILNYTAELVSYYEAGTENSVWTKELIIQEVQRILDLFYADLGWRAHSIERAMAKRQVAKTPTLKQFEAQHYKAHEVFWEYLKAYMQKEDSKQAAEELSLEDSLESLLNEMGLGEQEVSEEIQENGCNNDEAAELQQTKEESESQKETQQKEEVQLNQADEQNEKSMAAGVEDRAEGKILEEETERKAFLQHMNEMARLMGYELHKIGDKVMPQEYYEALMAEKEGAKAEIWRNLAKVDRQSVLSELYNAYHQIQHISLANLEAVLGNFFTMLALEGIEVEEDGTKVGDTIKVHTKEALKTFVLAQPTYREGEVEGTLLYKGWKYKEKTIMPKVIKVKEEV